jgi:hypothetical protein
MFCNNCGGHLNSASTDPTRRSGQSIPSYQPTQLASPAYGRGSDQYGSVNTSYGAPPPPPSEYQVPGYPAASTPSYTPSPTPGGYQQPVYPPQGGYPQQPVQKKGSNVGLIVGIVLLLIVIIGGGAFWYTSIRGSGGNTGVNTPTTSNTPTVAVTPTIAALFSDTFDSNKNGWDLDNGSNYSVAMSNGSLYLKLTEAGKILHEEIPNQPPADATITTKFTFVKGGSDDFIGVLLRNKSQNNNVYGYYINVFADNTYDIEVFYLDTSTNKSNVTALLKPQSTGLRPMGSENEMTITMKNSTITLIMNGQTVGTVTDSANTFTSGRTSLFVETGDASNDVQASFNSLAVYPAK